MGYYPTPYMKLNEYNLYNIKHPLRKHGSETRIST